MSSIPTQNGSGKRKKIKVDPVCVNPNCTKSRSDDVITASPFIISYYGAKLDEKRKRKVCQECFVQAETTLKNITSKLKSKQPIHDVPLPVIRDTSVVLDDSDEEKMPKTDLSSDSEIEYEAVTETDNIEEVIEATMRKLGVPEQIDGAIQNVSGRLDALNVDKSEIDANFLQLEKDVVIIKCKQKIFETEVA